MVLFYQCNQKPAAVPQRFLFENKNVEPPRKVVKLSLQKRADLLCGVSRYSSQFLFYKDSSNGKLLATLAMSVSKNFFLDSINMSSRASLLSYLVGDFVFKDSLQNFEAFRVYLFAPTHDKRFHRVWDFDTFFKDSTSLLISCNFPNGLNRRVLLFEGATDRMVKYDTSEAGVFKMYIQVEEEKLFNDTEYLQRCADAYGRLIVGYVVGDDFINTYHFLKIGFYQNRIEEDSLKNFAYGTNDKLFNDLIITRE
jgi:hypothetical protein